MSEPRSSRRADRNVAAPGRRSGGSRRIDLLVALAVGLPVVAALGLSAVGDGNDSAGGGLPPVSTALTSATLICPGALGKGAEPVLVARSARVSGGTVDLSRPGAGGNLVASGSMKVATGHNGQIRAVGASVLSATGAAAPGLVAGRREPGSAAACLTPAYDQWYAGIGASAVNDSVLTLVNPDAGQAVVDVELLGPNGPVAANALRGMVVPGHRVLVVDLARKAPSRLTLAAHVLVSRGRVGVSVEHRYDRLGGAPVVRNFLPALDDATTESVLLGVTVGGQSLTLANPGSDPVSATVRVLNGDSVFTPTGTKPVVVPAQGVARVPLTSVVPTSARTGMLGVVVESDAPLLAMTRGLVGHDLAAVGASPSVTGVTAAVVPDGPTRLVVAGAVRAGVVNLTFSNARGKVLGQRSVPVTAEAGVSITLPKGTAVVALDPRNTSIDASLVTSGRHGTSVVPVRDTIVTSSVPAVLPN